MNKPQVFRPINEIETQIINKSFKELVPSFFQFLSKEKYTIFVKIREGDKAHPFPELFLLSQEYVSFIKSADKRIYNAIEHVGLYLGFIKRGLVYLSIEAAEFLRDRGQIAKQYIIKVAPEAENGILYGNPIKAGVLKTLSKQIKKGDIILVENTKNEIISISKINYNLVEINQDEKNQVIASNLVDKGYYLRNE